MSGRTVKVTIYPANDQIGTLTFEGVGSIKAIGVDEGHQILSRDGSGDTLLYSPYTVLVVLIQDEEAGEV